MGGTGCSALAGFGVGVGVGAGQWGLVVNVI